MLVQTLSAALLVSAALASPIELALRNNDGVKTSYDAVTNLTWIYRDESLPKVILYDTGDGTILSGSNNGRLDNINYGGFPGSLTPEQLIGNTSEVLDIAQLAVQYYGASAAGGGSANADSDRFLNISKHATERMCNKGSDIVGAVMVHGTNSLAETAFGVDLTFNCSKPFIATGSMRPNSALSHDGPFNFYDAVRAAVHPESRDRGAMLSFDDHLISAFYGTKINGNTVGTFKALDQGYIAQFLGGQPYFFFGPSLPTARHYFDPFAVQFPLPQVDILYAHQGFDANSVYSAANNGAKGIVIMGVGPGAISTAASAALRDVQTQGVMVVVSLRTPFGAVVPPPQPAKLISSGFLHGEQSRIQLQLAIASGYDFNAIQRLFEKDIRAAVYNSATSYYNGTTF